MRFYFRFAPPADADSKMSVVVDDASLKPTVLRECILSKRLVQLVDAQQRD